MLLDTVSEAIEDLGLEHWSSLLALNISIPQHFGLTKTSQGFRSTPALRRLKRIFLSWMNFGKSSSHIESGGYFGYSCFEAVAAVKAFGLGDRLCIGHPHGQMIIRDALTTSEYWDHWVNFLESSFSGSIQLISQSFKNPSYQPQFVRDLAFRHAKLIYFRYSRGDSISELIPYFQPLLLYWEESERMSKDVWTAEQRYKRRTWSVNIDQYIDCFWLVGLGIALDIPESQWRRLIALCGNDGEDALLDRIIATRSSDRRIGSKICYPKPYQRLLRSIDASPSKQPKLLRDFVENWYRELAVAAKSGGHPQAFSSQAPYWYSYHQPMKGAYFGYWCIEAVAAAKAFNLDDSLCVGHPNYPGDLLRPGTVTAPDTSRMLPKLAASIGAPPEPPFTGEPRDLTTWESLKLVIKNKFSP